MFGLRSHEGNIGHVGTRKMKGNQFPFLSPTASKATFPFLFFRRGGIWAKARGGDATFGGSSRGIGSAKETFKLDKLQLRLDWPTTLVQ